MLTLLNKAKGLSVKGKQRLGQYSSGKLGSEEVSPSFSHKRREAALKADLFAGPDKIVSAGNTYGLIKLTIHEAKVKPEDRYCAVVSIGMQASVCRKCLFTRAQNSTYSLYDLQTYMSRTDPRATCTPSFEEGTAQYTQLPMLPCMPHSVLVPPRTPSTPRTHDHCSVAPCLASVLQVTTWCCNTMEQLEPILRFTAPVDLFVANSRRACAGKALIIT